MKIEDVTSQLLDSIEQQIIELFEEKGSKSNIEALFRIRYSIFNEVGINKVTTKLNTIENSIIDPLTSNSISVFTVLTREEKANLFNKPLFFYLA